MAKLFEDTFNRADGAPGNDWILGAGNWVIASNQLKAVAASQVIERLVPVGAVADLQVDIITGPDMVWTASHNLIVYLRTDGNRQNCYRVQWLFGVTGTAYCRIDKYVGGTNTILAIYYQINLSAGSHTLSQACTGSNIVARLDGVVVAAAIDGSILGGSYVGIIAGTANEVYIDTFSIYDVQASQMYIVPSVVPQATAGLQLDLYGIGTQWTPGTPGDPEFTSSNAGITAQTIYGPAHATLTYTSPTYAQVVTITDPNYGRTCQLTISSGSVYPPSGGSESPPWWVMAAGLAEAFEIMKEALLVVLDPIGITLWDTLILAENESLLGYARAQGVGEESDTLFSLVYQILRQLDTDSESPNSVRHIANQAWSEAAASHTALEALTVTYTLTLQDVIDAIGTGGGEHSVDDVFSLLTDTLAEIYLIEGDPKNTLLDIIELLGTVQTTLDNMSFPDLTQLAADVASTLSKVDAMDGDASTDLPAVKSAVDTVQTTLDNMSFPDLTQLAADVASILSKVDVMDGDGSTDLPALLASVIATDGDVTGSASTIEGAVADVAAGIADVKDMLSDIEGTLADIAAAIAAIPKQPAVWPASGNVQITHVVPLSAPGSVTYDMDGAILDVTDVPSQRVGWSVDDTTNLYYVGFFVFVDAHGVADERQPIAFTHQMCVPKNMTRPAGIVLSFRAGVTCTVQTWDLV